MLPHRRGLLSALGLILILSLLISCAQTEGTGTPSQPQNDATSTVSVPSTQPVSIAPVTSSPTSVRPVMAVTPTSSPASIHPVGTATPATTVTGMVTLTTSAPHYLVTNTIVVTISNQTNQQIIFPDHLTDCTTILLRLQVPGGWQSVGECQLMIRTSEHMLDPGQSVTVALKAPGQWTAGLYQATINYAPANHPTAGKVISSPTFSVGVRN